MLHYHKRLCCYITAVCKKRVKTVLETSPADVLQPFKDRMEEFLERGMATQVVRCGCICGTSVVKYA